jgi:hypothetical protein
MAYLPWFGKNSYVLVKGYDPKLTFEELRNHYDNSTGVSKLKLLSVNDQEMIAAFYFEGLEGQYRGLGRALIDGFFWTKEAFVVGDKNPIIQKIIDSQTRLRIRYSSQDVKDPTDFKESLLQLLSKVGGHYKIKKDHILAEKQELIILVDSSFTLGKLTTTGFLQHQGVEISLEYLIDRISHEKLKHLLNPEYLEFDPNNLNRSKDFHLLLDILFPKWNASSEVSDDEISVDAASIHMQECDIGLSDFPPTSTEDDNLEELFTDDHLPAYSATYRKFLKTEQMEFFNKENNLNFLSIWRYFPFVNQLKEIHGDPKIQQNKMQNGIENSLDVSHEIFKLAILIQKLSQYGGTGLHYLLRAFQSESHRNLSDPIIANLTNHLCKRLKRLNKNTMYDPSPPRLTETSPQLRLGWRGTGDSLSSDELWKILQSCDPEWRDFIWKYRTVEHRPETQLETDTPINPAQHQNFSSEPIKALNSDLKTATQHHEAAEYQHLQSEDSLQRALIPIHSKIQAPDLRKHTKDKLAGSPTPHTDCESRQAPGDDLWSLQHIESNLRFNRMVSPMLWR